MKTQRGEVTCPRSHSYQLAGQVFEHRQFCSIVHTHNHYALSIFYLRSSTQIVFVMETNHTIMPDAMHIFGPLSNSRGCRPRLPSLSITFPQFSGHRLSWFLFYFSRIPISFLFSILFAYLTFKHWDSLGLRQSLPCFPTLQFLPIDNINPFFDYQLYSDDSRSPLSSEVQAQISKLTSLFVCLKARSNAADLQLVTRLLPPPALSTQLVAEAAVCALSISPWLSYFSSYP